MTPPESARPGPRSGAGFPASAPPASGRSDLALVVLLGILWGSAFPVIRAGLVGGAPPLLFAAVRYALTAAAIVGIAGAARIPRPRWADVQAPAVFGGLLMIGTYGGLLYLGEETTTGALAAILTASAPLASAGLGLRLLPSERLGRWGAGGLLVGFVGVGVLVLPQLLAGSPTGVVGPLLVLAAVLAFAIGSVLLRRTQTAAPGLWTLSFQFAVAAGFVGLLSVGAGEPASLGTGSVVLPSLGFLVVFPGILGYALYFRIHHTSGPTTANVVGYVNPATGVLVGLLVFGETVSGIEVGGLALIALGLFLLQKGRGAAAPPAAGRPLTGSDEQASDS